VGLFLRSLAQEATAADSFQGFLIRLDRGKQLNVYPFSQPKAFSFSSTSEGLAIRSNGGNEAW
jgi:hypothetical protein